MTYNDLERQSAPEKPCLVSTERGFSVSYKGRFLYSKYAPERAVLGMIDSVKILPGTLILAASPVLWLGLDSLLKKLPEDCFVLAFEYDEALHEFASEEFKKLHSKGLIPENLALLPFKFNDYLVNILNGDYSSEICLPHISTFRRSIFMEMSAGTWFHKDDYLKTASLAQNAIASFWKNRITLTRLGRLYSRNLFRNLAKLPKSIDFNDYAGKVEQPIFLFGAGESIEETLKHVPKSLIEKCFVLAVDAVVPALKAYGIRIDGVCAVEGQLAIEKAYIGADLEGVLLFADMTSRVQVTRHSKNVCYFSSEFTDAFFLKNLSEKDFFPLQIPPLGSVGLTSIYIALKLRSNQNVPVIFSGLDFSFSLGRTHTKNVPAHIARLCAAGRFLPIENYAASFKNGAKRFLGKNGIELFTDSALENYAKSFVDAFQNMPNLYDCGKQGFPLGVQQISSETLSAYLNTVKSSGKTEIYESKYLKGDIKINQLRAYFESEEKALNRIKELLMYGKEVGGCSISVEDELYALISKREYLFLHFPDGYKCNTKDLSFLKRVRGQIDFFLKDIKMGIKQLDC
ncbi:6-hydroxymethylpterin diphosphokinase MptE-like protein [uncultured Treponema sp.]|uniref:6-hydroxymethylpterin diphosphokinase MptE-like protein n=1 Tax=uncultured Treponema sp. TaxID=162155 RepID=UPI0025D9FAD0|nr:6-hydroxymethylpterin diphosphokinase MptE-like protein [uncultured Treponema sp.]